MQAKLSIIVPVYNVEKYLQCCIESLINQTYRNLEIILIDDGSTDNSPTICDHYATIDNRVKVIHKTNAGAGMARNTGLDVASGELLTFVDSDDYLELNAFSHLVELTEKHDLDILRFSNNEFTTEDKFSHIYDKDDLEIFATAEEITQIQLCLFSRPVNDNNQDINLGGAPWGAIYRSDIIKKNNIRYMSEHEIISEDYIFNYDYLNHVKRIAKTHKTLYHWRLTPNSITRAPKKDNVIRTVATAKLMTQKFSTDNIGDRAEKYAMGFVIELLRAHIKNILISGMDFKNKIEWLHCQSKIPYIDYIRNNYPWKKLRLKHRINFWAFSNHHFRLLYYLVVGQEKLRNLIKSFK